MNPRQHPGPWYVAAESLSSFRSCEINGKPGNDRLDAASAFASVTHAFPRRSHSCPDFSTIERPLQAQVEEQELLQKFNEAMVAHLGHILHVICRDNERNFAKIEAAIRDLERGLPKKSNSPFSYARSRQSSPDRSADKKSNSAFSSRLSRQLSPDKSHDQISEPSNEFVPLGPAGDSPPLSKQSSDLGTTVDPSSLQGWDCSSAEETVHQSSQTRCNVLSNVAKPNAASKNVKTLNIKRQVCNTSSDKASPGKGPLDSEFAGSAQPKQVLGNETLLLRQNSPDLTKSRLRLRRPSTTSSASSVPGMVELAIMDELLHEEKVEPESVTKASTTSPQTRSPSRSSGRTTSTNSGCSLEALRQRKDSVLAFSGLTSKSENQCWNRPGSGHALVVTELSSAYRKPNQEEVQMDELPSNSRLQRLPWIILHLCGIIPWRQGSILSSLYSLISLLLATALVAYPTLRIAQGRVDSIHLCILPFTVTGLLGALSLRHSFTMQLFSEFPGPLERYSMKHGFAIEFLNGSLSHFVLMFFLWVCVALTRGVGEVLTFDGVSCSADNDPWVFVCFLIGSILFVVLLYCQLHVICLLGMMVDRYCVKLFPSPTSCQVVLDWNLIQAMLRQIAGAFDFCFMITQTGAFAAVLLVAVHILIMERMDVDGNCHESLLTTTSLLLSPVLLASGAFVVFFKAASVSEKCSRVAPLVNSLAFNDEEDVLDSRRMNTVNFISSSAAGFYIQEVRITASMAMKLIYITGLGAFALMTKLATDAGI